MAVSDMDGWECVAEFPRPLDEVARLTRDIETLQAAIEHLRADKAAIVATMQATVDTAVAQALMSWPVPKDGRDAEPVTPEALDAAVAKHLGAHPPAQGRDGKDGVGLASSAVTRDGTLLLTMTDGRTQDIGPVVGADGAPGRDGKDGEPGLSFGDLTVEHDGERIFTFKAVRGDQVKALGTFTVPAQIHRGVWRPGATYAYQDVVTWGGSQWVCMQAETQAKPGEPGADSRAWVMTVRRGDAGKQGPAGDKGPRGEKGEKGETQFKY